MLICEGSLYTVRLLGRGGLSPRKILLFRDECHCFKVTDVYAHFAFWDMVISLYILRKRGRKNIDPIIVLLCHKNGNICQIEKIPCVKRNVIHSVV